MQIIVREVIEHTVEVPTGDKSYAAELARVDELSVWAAGKHVAIQYVAGASQFTGVQETHRVVKSRTAKVVRASDKE